MRKFESIRTEIKTLSNLQGQNKPQRKFNHSVITGITPEKATILVVQTKYELRHLFQAYAILKGVERPEVKKPSNYNGLLLDEKKIQEMVEKFKPVEVLEDAVGS